MKRLALLLAAAAALVAIAAALPVAIPLTGRDDGVPLYTVARQPFVRRVPAQGYLRAVHSLVVAAPIYPDRSFHVAWLAPDGSPVRAGEVVARFDPSDADKELADALSDLAGARVKAEKQDVQSLAEIDKLERDAELARLELRNATQFQKKDELLFSRHDIITSGLDQHLAEEREKHALARERSSRKLATTELDLLAIQIRKAQSKIANARAGLAALTVAAPHDGVLVLQRNWRGETVRIGEEAWPGQPLAEIPDLSRMQAEVYVLEADAGGLAPGKPATVVVESDAATSYPARIVHVDSLAKPRVRGSPVQYFAVTLTLARTDPRVMKPGQRVEASLLLDSRRDALAVPRQAIFERDGRTIVYRARTGNGGGFAPVAVTLGASGMGRTIVESGLAAGDRIALRDPARMQPAPRMGEGRGGPGAAGPAAGAEAASGPAGDED